MNTASRKILVFGSTRVGKSSLIESLTGSKVITDSSKSTTFAATIVEHCHESIEYEFIEVCGLNQVDSDTSVPNKNSLKYLISMVRSISTDLDLLIYVVERRLTSDTSSNFKLFVQTITESKIPLLVVVTGCENTVSPSVWAENPTNVEALRRSGIPEGTVIISSSFASSKDTELEALYAKKRALSASVLWNAIKFYNTSFDLTSRKRSEYSVMKDAWDFVCDYKKWPSFFKIGTVSLHTLLVVIGHSPEEATSILQDFEIHCASPASNDWFAMLT